MPQPAAVDELTDPTVQAYRTAWERILVEQQRLGADPLRLTKQRRLLEMRLKIEGILDTLDADVAKDYVADALPKIYQLGGSWGAQLIGSQFSWDSMAQNAVQSLAQSAWNDLLAATHGVRESTKELVRQVAKDEGLQAMIASGTAQDAGREMARVLADNGIFSVRFADGSRHGLGEYSEMVQRTKSAVAYNTGTVNSSPNVRYYEIFDGPQCGLSFHDDPTLASGMIVPRDDTFKYVIAHPNCRRSFGPRPDILTPADAARAAGGSVLPEQVAAQKLQDAQTLARQQRVAARQATRNSRLAARGQVGQTVGGERPGTPLLAGGARPFTAAEYEAMIDPQLARLESGLTEYELQVRGAYSSIGSAYHDTINRSLVSAEPPVSHLLEVRALDKAIDLGDAIPDRVVYRAVSGDLADAFQAAKVGDTIRDFAYSSTSVDRAEAEKFLTYADKSKTKVLLEIQTSKDARGLLGFLPEKELILRRDTQFQVVSKEGDTIKVRMLERATAIPTGRAAEIDQQLKELENSLHKAPGGGARARIKRQMEKLTKEKESLQGGEVKPIKPEPPKPVVPPVIKKFGDLRDDLPDLSDVPDLATIKKEHFGWTDAVATKERNKQIEAKLPTVDQLRKQHIGWTTAVAEKRLADLREHLGLPTGKSPVPVKLKTLVKPVSLLPPDNASFDDLVKARNDLGDRISRLQTERNALRKSGAGQAELRARDLEIQELERVKRVIEVRVTSFDREAAKRAAEAIPPKAIEDRIAAVRAKYEKQLGVEEPAGFMNSYLRDTLSSMAERDPAWAERHLVDSSKTTAKMQYGFFHKGPTGEYRAVGWGNVKKADLDALIADFGKEMTGSEAAQDRAWWIDHVTQTAKTGFKVRTTASRDQIKAFLKLPEDRRMPDARRKMIYGKVESASGKYGSGVKSAADFYQDVLDKDVARAWDRTAVGTEANRTGRAFYRPDRNVISIKAKDVGYGNLRPSGSTAGEQARVVVHELGHALEDNVGREIPRGGVSAKPKGPGSIRGGPGRSVYGGGSNYGPQSWMQDQARRFLSYRISQSEEREASEIYRGSGEMGWKDKFISHYMGKVYNTDTEIISMGMEQLYANPEKLLAEDPEYFWFMVGILKGEFLPPT